MSQSKKFLLLLLVVLIGILLYFALNYQNTSSKRLEDKSTTRIETFHSSTDRDQDGIDDQTDMLQGALAYIETKPKYKSKYYVGGYPDDQYGVCTDVVANACLAAGYDLQQLVNQDIVDHPEEYDIEEPDPNIDFRRVRNLKVYFKRNAVELTTDIQRTEEWQGGDIVIFKSHIGIVSDRRNERGIPYVIHHNDPMQTQYEQDILEKRDDIVGHYRISE
jgi:uncharacterized protein YijF (DUF1287 family)